jgi:TAZ zinc finger
MSINAAEPDNNSSVQSNQHIKTVQQRLLLLHHGSTCILESNPESKTDDRPCCQIQLCSQMKNVWKHMCACRDQRYFIEIIKNYTNCRGANNIVPHIRYSCSFNHCESSKRIMSHYSQCKFSNCLLCGPLRFQISQNESDGF